MKNLLALVLFITASVFVSCSKEELPAPGAAPAPVSINVEYRVSSVSGHFTVEYLAPENGQLVTKTETIDRTNFSFPFSWTKGSDFSIKAWNTIASGKEVKVEIYVNGQLQRDGLANAPGAVATAEAHY